MRETQGTSPKIQRPRNSFGGPSLAPVSTRKRKNRTRRTRKNQRKTRVRRR